MRSIGIDLAAGPRTTAAAVITWEGSGAVVSAPEIPCSDEQLLALLKDLGPEDRAGVDCPFGWPTAFVAAVSAHGSSAAWPGRGMDSADHRATMRLRRTDVVAQHAIGRAPLSVAFDKLGAAAARWAHLADALAAAGRPVDRSGAGAVVEVYPAASRHRWGLSRERSLAEVQAALPWLEFAPGAAAAYERNEHAFDALVAALTARAAAQGLTEGPGKDDQAVAEVEGWIHLPAPDSLGRLL